MTRLIPVLLIWMLVFGGLPVGLVEEQPVTESSVGESMVLCWKDSLRERPVVSIRSYPPHPGSRPPAGEPTCQRTRIRALPTEQRGPPTG